jgi:Gram-negative bacterial TonB protein C-terminal
MLHRKKVSAGFGAILLAVALSWQPASSFGAGKVLTHDDMISHPTPPYPAQALINHEAATVQLRLTIKNGKLTDVVALSGPSQFTSVAARWVKATWSFKPTVSGTYNMPIYYGVWRPKRPQKQRRDGQALTR